MLSRVTSKVTTLYSSTHYFCKYAVYFFVLVDSHHLACEKPLMMGNMIGKGTKPGFMLVEHKSKKEQSYEES